MGAARAAQYQPMFAQLAAGHHVHPDNQLPARLMMATLLKKSDLIKMPNLIVGFKLADTKRAVEMLAQLELLVSIVCDSNPKTRGHWKRTPLGKYEYLVLSLDGSMVPWDQVPVDDLRRYETKPGDADKLIERLKKLTLTISLGLRDDYLLLAIGPSTAALAHLGEGPHLAGCPQLKPLEKFADKRLTSIGYVSAALNAQISDSNRGAKSTTCSTALDKALPGMPLTPDQVKRIRADAGRVGQGHPGPDSQGRRGRWNSASSATAAAKATATSGATSRALDGSKPLGLPSHFGGTPLWGFAARAKPCLAQYDTLVKWLRVGHRLFRRVRRAEDVGQRTRAIPEVLRSRPPASWRGSTRPTARMLLPALADGQIGLVLDAKLQSKQFLKNLPATAEADADGRAGAGPGSEQRGAAPPGLWRVLGGRRRASRRRAACGSQAQHPGRLQIAQAHRHEVQIGRDCRLARAGQVRRRQGDFPQRRAVGPGGRAHAFAQPHRATAGFIAMEDRRAAVQLQPAVGAGRRLRLGRFRRCRQALGRSGRARR